MNKNIKLAVAGAVLAAASAAQAGIIVPAGEWTLDIGGNVNTYAVWARSSGSASVIGGLSGDAVGGRSNNAVTNGLLPNFLSVSGSTRQNDLDVAFTISLQPGSYTSAALTGVGSAGNGGLNNRQSFLTFGDKSWGSVKVGKDLGIFASDAILSDMTLLGVGATFGNATTAGNTTLGRIGAGYIYADWKPQIAYTTPNMSGFQATVGVSQAFSSASTVGSVAYSTNLAISAASTTIAGNATRTLASGTKNSNLAYEGKASYSFAANDVTGKVWVSGLAQHVGNLTRTDSASIAASVIGVGGLTYTNTAAVGNEDPMAYVGDIGANLNVAGLGLTGYYYSGKGIGTTGQMLNGYGLNAAGKAEARDSDGGYIQATYALPTKTKLGVSWGISSLDKVSGDSTNLVKDNEMWTVGAYHPLTKHLNLVAEYAHLTSQNHAGAENKTNAGSVGAILFF
jgi:predicted porin